MRIHCRACHVRWAQDRNLQRISQGREREGEGALMSQSSSAQQLSRGKLAPEIERIKRKMWKRRLLHEHPSLPAGLWPLSAFHSPTGRLHARSRLAPGCPLTGDAFNESRHSTSGNKRLFFLFCLLTPVHLGSEFSSPDLARWERNVNMKTGMLF